MSSMFAYCVGPAALVAPPVTVPLAPTLSAFERRLGLARLHLARGEWADALGAFEAALLHEPRFAIGHLGRAICLTQLGRETEARAALSEALAASQGQEHVLVPLARMMAREGHVSLAIPLLGAAVRAMPHEAERLARDPLFADHPAYLQVLGVL